MTALSPRDAYLLVHRKHATDDPSHRVIYKMASWDEALRYWRLAAPLLDAHIAAEDGTGPVVEILCEEEGAGKVADYSRHFPRAQIADLSALQQRLHMRLGALSRSIPRPHVPAIPGWYVHVRRYYCDGSACVLDNLYEVASEEEGQKMVQAVNAARSRYAALEDTCTLERKMPPEVLHHLADGRKIYAWEAHSRDELNALIVRDLQRLAAEKANDEAYGDLH